MAKLTIDLDPDTHERLKQLAIEDERSLTQYIQRTLRRHAGTLVVNTTTSMLVSHKKSSDISVEKEDNLW